MKKKALAAALGLILSSAVFVQAMEKDSDTPAAASIAPAEIGKPAPDFTLKDLSGKKMSLSELKGKKVMINFWATWCPPCESEVPAMQQLYTEKQGSFEILAVNLDPANNIKSFASEYQLSFPILLDEKDEINRVYGILSVPTTFFINEKGIITDQHVGSMNYEQMEKYLNKIK